MVSLAITLKNSTVSPFVKEHELAYLEPFIQTAHQLLHEKRGPGKEFLGWMDLPSTISPQEIRQVEEAASRIRSSCDIFLVIGIGGSYLGSAAAVEFLSSPYYNQTRKQGTPEIYFVGNSISEIQLTQLLELCEGKDLCINMISKSGTTTEPAIAFRFFRQLLEDRYGAEGAAKRIFATTDEEKGTLKKLADEKGYSTFVIPDTVGGRFSVLTPVGLLPIAVAGGDLHALLGGAKKAETAYNTADLWENPCYMYAAYRTILRQKGKDTEVLISYEPSLRLFGEWYKQLFGESEGKDGKGLFPASMIFSTDLHSLGQYLQDGRRNLFETVLHIEKGLEHPLTLSQQSGDYDGLNYLAGMSVKEINNKAMEGTILAHKDGQVPILLLTLPDLSEDSLGQLFYFFEKACALSGYLLGVNPFDQPGVEDYKKNMFALLGKPGFEDRRRELTDNT